MRPSLHSANWFRLKVKFSFARTQMRTPPPPPNADHEEDYKVLYYCLSHICWKAVAHLWHWLMSRSDIESQELERWTHNSWNDCNHLVSNDLNSQNNKLLQTDNGERCTSWTTTQGITWQPDCPESLSFVVVVVAILFLACNYAVHAQSCSSPMTALIILRLKFLQTQLWSCEPAQAQSLTFM